MDQSVAVYFASGENVKKQKKIRKTVDNRLDICYDIRVGCETGNQNFSP